MKTIAKELRATFGSGLRENVQLAPHTWIHVGGPAEFFLEVHDEETLLQALNFTREHGMPCTFLGGGSNVFADDDGLDGLVLVNRIEITDWRESAHYAVVSAGYDLDTFVYEASERGWADLTFAAGIPGTIGGGLVGGAGAYGQLIYEFVERARICRPDGTVETVPVEALGIQYRESEALERGDIVLKVFFRPFAQAKPETLLQRIEEIKADRRQKHPPENLPCAGSFFKNLPPSEPGGWRIPAGKLLDECNAKSMSSGGAAVFEKHANIIVNTGSATAHDINTLADRMAAAVQEKHGIKLVREVHYLSNKHNA